MIDSDTMIEIQQNRILLSISRKDREKTVRDSEK